MTITCAGCSAEVLPSSVFCQRCGRRLETARESAPEATADRRQVTVLFADLSGFTALAEALDPETVRSFQNALFETLAQAIARSDGFVEKFVGDAVMAVFGAPRAHEDDPLRALEAAQDMLQRVERLSLLWKARLGRAVTLHIGIHSGPVVAGSLGSGSGSAYAVTGDTVNTASRLLGAAAPGTVLVSEPTHAMVRHRFDFAPPVELALRGKAQPLRARQLLGARSDATSARGLAELGLAAPLVGREAALAQLDAAFERMQGGRSQVLSLVGEAGAGKSRLLEEFFARRAADPRLAATGVRRTACAARGEPAYGTFGALFREVYRIEAGDSLQIARDKLHRGLAALGANADEVDAVARVVGHLLGIEEADPRDIAPEQLQRQITLAARALLERRLARQPVLVVIDDLQWADAASVDLLSELLDQLADRPLMLLVAQRPEARPLRPRQAQQATVELGPLDGVQTDALVSSLLGRGGQGDADGGDGLAPVRALVAARAGGNPLFVEEIVRSLAGAGLLRRESAGWVCERAGEALEVPPTLYGLLLSRLDRLAPAERRVLQEAAVLGAEFELALLRRVASDPAAVAPALARLAEAELLHGGDDSAAPSWRFVHALLHEVAYQNLLLTRRTELHQRAGRALEERLAPELAAVAGGAPRVPLRLAELEALGHHWSLSPEKARGARYQLAAGDRARAVYANDDAIRHYRRALATLAEAPAPAEPQTDTQDAEAIALDARERLADLLGLQGRRSEALAHYAQVREGAGRRREPVRAARALRKTGGLHWEAGEREQARACFDAGLAALGAQGEPVERAHLYQEMGRLAFRAGDNDAALALARQALDELPAAPAGAGTEAEVVRAEASNTLGIALARLGRPAEAVAQIEHGLAQAQAHGLLQAACRGYTNLGVLYASLDPQRSIATCLRGLETARKVGDLGVQSRLYANLAVAYCALTDRCDAEGIEAARAAASLDRRLGLLDHLAVPLIVLGQIHQCHGDAAPAFACYREALQLAERIDEPQLLFPCYDGLATLYLDSGQTAQAEAYLARAQAVCERAGLEPDALLVLPFLC